MKNTAHISCVGIIALVFLTFNFWPTSAYGQSKTQEQTLLAFPDSMATIFKQSCVGCHHDLSESKAKTFMNLSEWEMLNPKKQAKTARSINRQVAKGVMPPESSLKDFPEEALSADQKQTIKAWSKAIRANKGK